MPKEQKTQTEPKKEFNSEMFIQKVREAVMKKEWGTAVLAQADTIKIEAVRVGNTSDIMVRVSGQKPGNALKMTTTRHIENFIDLVRMIADNEGNLMDKLNALKSVLKEDSTSVSVIL